MRTNYNIMRDDEGKQRCRFFFEWVDEHGKTEIVETDDVETAQTVIGLLSGEISIGDLEP